jgi:flagellar motor switch protein FliN/FliY
MDTRIIARQGEVLGALAAELCTVVGSLLDVPARMTPSERPLAADWVVRLDLAGAHRGSITLGFASADAGAITSRLMGLDGTAPAEAVADTLQEIVAQAAGGLSQKPLGLGTSFTMSGPPGQGSSPPGGSPLTFEFEIADLTVAVACWTDLEPSSPELVAPVEEAVRDEPAAPPPLAPPPAEVSPPAAGAGARRADNIDMILDVELPITVRFGHTELSIQSLSRIGPGSVIELNRSPDDPVEVLINGKMIARGEVVVVGGNYGVRVTEVSSPTDRIRTMGA